MPEDLIHDEPGHDRPSRERPSHDPNARRPHGVGDAWVDGPKGRFWGTFGAAGLLIELPGRGVLLQLRAEWSHHGGTWGLPGGARKPDESAEVAAIREADEEASVPPDAVEVIDILVNDLGYWSYSTVVARASSDSLIGFRFSARRSKPAPWRSASPCWSMYFSMPAMPWLSTLV